MESAIDYRKRFTQKQKEANDFAWYKAHMDRLSTMSFTMTQGYGEVDMYRNMRVNYDLFNNIINLKDFEYVCQPYGAQVGELPAKMTNRDIISGKIKALLGMEMKRPFSWKVVAVNEEATTRREQEEFSRVKEFVVNSITQPIRERVAMEYEQQLKGRELSEEEQLAIKQQVEEQIKAQTPPEIRNYMLREHQDPAEAMMHQLMEYLIRKEDIAYKFNLGWKHSLIAGPDLYWVGILRGEPAVRVINPERFDHDRGPDIERVEDGDWAAYESFLSLSQIQSIFELTDEEYRKLASDYPFGDPQRLTDADFTFSEGTYDTSNRIRVVHYEWKSERKIGFLSYLDKDGQKQTSIVNEDYKFSEENGDLEIDWQWIPEKHEGYKIGRDIYKMIRPVPGQHVDLDDLFNCKLSYIGACHDNLNSMPTSPVDRMKPYQYYYNIIMYRIENLMASDKGKKILMNINAIPKSAGIDISKFMYYGDALNILFVNGAEEGNRNANMDVTNMAKELDMSLASDIQKYIALAEYIEERCGASVGITKLMEGQIGPNDAVTNTKQSLLQSSHILEPYFELHNTVKRNVLQQLLNVAKVAYSLRKPTKLSFVLDDLSLRMLETDPEILSASTCNIYVSNSSKAFEAKQMVENLAHSAMQNQTVDLSALIKLIGREGIQEAEELLKAGEEEKHEKAMALQKQQSDSQKELLQMQQQNALQQHEREKELIILKEEQRRETELQKQAMLSMGFNEDKDIDKDGTPDVYEIYKDGEEAQLKRDKLSLEKDKFEHQKEKDKKELEIKRKQAAKKGK